MGAFTSGIVVLIPFPFSDLSQSKVRPALILAETKQNEYVLCQITSKAYSDSQAIEITNEDFINGGLRKVSYVRTSKLFTGSGELFLSQAGELSNIKFNSVIDQIIQMFSSEKRKS